MQHTSINAAQASANAQATSASTTNGTSVDSIFRVKSAVTVEAKAVVPGVKSAVAKADALCASYTQLRVDVLDRSDKALWSLLEQVYAYVDSLLDTEFERDTRVELIKAIKMRGKEGVSTGATLEAAVVRYVFADVSRQTCSNYTLAMKKAKKLKIATNDFANFLAINGGVSKVIENDFAYEQAAKEDNAAVAKAMREEKQSRTELVDRLYTAMAVTADTQLEYKGTVANWVPAKQVKEGKSADKQDKVDLKHEQGNFVLFVTRHNPATGKYHVVQGNVWRFEQQLLGTIAERMGAGTDELEQAVAGLEQQLMAAQMPAAA